MRRLALSFCLSLTALFGQTPKSGGSVDASTLDNKVLLGYQGWFQCPKDGTNWSHWSRGAPAPETLSIDLYPDLREFDPDELCEVPGMTIGAGPAYLFSSRIPKTVMRHFQWMREYGLDGVLVQRFAGTIPAKRKDGDLVLKNIMNAARETGRTFAIEYDISGGNPDTFVQSLKDDWMYLVDDLKVTAHPNYQRHNGKPLLSVWGMGLNDGNNHPPTDPKVAKDLIEWFKAGAAAKYRVTYMGGTLARWRTLTADARTDPAWADVYSAMDIVQPWTVGRYHSPEEADHWKENELIPDQAARFEKPDLHACGFSRLLLAQPASERERESDSPVAWRISMAPGVQCPSSWGEGTEDRDVR